MRDSVRDAAGSKRERNLQDGCIRGLERLEGTLLEDSFRDLGKQDILLLELTLQRSLARAKLA